MQKRNFQNGQHLSAELVTALSADQTALDEFHKLSPEKRQNYIDAALTSHSRGQMQSYLTNLKLGEQLFDADTGMKDSIAP